MSSSRLIPWRLNPLACAFPVVGYEVEVALGSAVLLVLTGLKYVHSFYATQVMHNPIHSLWHTFMCVEYTTLLIIYFRMHSQRECTLVVAK